MLGKNCCRQALELALAPPPVTRHHSLWMNSPRQEMSIQIECANLSSAECMRSGRFRCWGSTTWTCQLRLTELHCGQAALSEASLMCGDVKVSTSRRPWREPRTFP